MEITNGSIATPVETLINQQDLKLVRNKIGDLAAEQKQRERLKLQRVKPGRLG